jgi:MFS superfamily sulfate permease-like transporter
LSEVYATRRRADLPRLRRVFFGAADKLETALKRAQQEPKLLILRMRKVLAMDATGLNALEDLC